MKHTWAVVFAVAMALMVVIVLGGVASAERFGVPVYEHEMGQVMGSWGGNIYIDVTGFGMMEFQSSVDFPARTQLHVLLENQEIVAVMWAD